MTVSELLDEGIARLEKARVSFGHGTTNVLDEAVWLLLHSLVVSFNERHLRAARDFGIEVLPPAGLLKLIGEIE